MIFEVFGSEGTLLVDDLTGDVIDRHHYECSQEGYPDITRLDLEEWHEHYPGEETINGHEIYDFGFWKADCSYTPPNKVWRYLYMEGVIEDKLEGVGLSDEPTYEEVHERYLRYIHRRKNVTQVTLPSISIL